mmetsp:Transcript_23737/g.45220  ORF Transcript_23737/g.45220 Transcript_23737/m.45220 type:complete len:368 (-) Transcript_23737:743-1846(-)
MLLCNETLALDIDAWAVTQQHSTYLHVGVWTLSPGFLRSRLRDLSIPGVCGNMHTSCSTPGRIQAVFPCLVPLDGSSSAARNGRPAWDRQPRGGLREVAFEQLPVVVCLLGWRRVVGEAVLGAVHHLVRDLRLRVVLELVDPAVPHTVTELLFLPPEHAVGQVGVLLVVKCAAEHVLFDSAFSLVDHLVCWVHSHGHLQKALVQERDARLEAPGGGGLVGAQAVVHVQRLELVARLHMELLLVGGLVEVEVAPKHLVRALARQHHLHSARLDLARHQKHGRAGPDGGDVVRLYVVDHVRQRVNALLHGEGELVVVRAQERGHLPGGKQVGRALQPHAERVQLAPGVVLRHVAISDGGHQARVQPARE